MISPQSKLSQILLLAAFAFPIQNNLATLVVESIQPNADGVAIVLRNNSAKTITAFGFKYPNTQFRDNLEGIKPGTSYQFQLPQAEVVTITSVVFDDGSTEGQEAFEILARRDGRRHAEADTAKQVSRFLRFNSVIDDSALSSLDRELEESAKIPALWTSSAEKHAWQAGYENTRESVRKAIKEVPPSHRLQQLRRIGGGR